MFSVIIPVYNGEKFVETAVQSVIGQTFSEWELVIVNDGSTDNTAEILKKYNDNLKIKVITQKNGGVSAARNTGIENSIGEYIAFLDCDDLWKSNHLETLTQMIDKYPNAGLYATFSEINLVNGNTITKCDYFKNKPETVYIEDFFEEYNKDKSAKIYNPSSACISREAAIKAGGFPIGCKIGEDLAYFFIISAYFPVVLSSKATAVYEKVNSVATKDVSFDPDWYFFEEVKNLLCDTEINEEKRKNLAETMQWFQMRRSRHYMIDGKRKQAIEAYRSIGKSKNLKKDKFFTLILLCLPSALVKKIFLIRWRSQA